jgi:hypothetical protein
VPVPKIQDGRQVDILDFALSRQFMPTAEWWSGPRPAGAELYLSHLLDAYTPERFSYNLNSLFLKYTKMDLSVFASRTRH